MVRNVKSWTVDDVANWITEEKLDFDNFRAKCVKYEVDGPILLEISLKDLRDDFGINPGAKRRKIFKAIQKLKEGTKGRRLAVFHHGIHYKQHVDMLHHPRPIIVRNPSFNAPRFLP
eukprot:TRINITY_DN1001_c0_g1_i1.p1 TRINITY_DN1001_c0_g1~~TRINITY_DN1001_c0_g1_i1.p1  ORF type:complete len:117 (-),score=13.35 TRINITY_DN1001_c0_g1_i1:114-464(-)